MTDMRDAEDDLQRALRKSVADQRVYERDERLAKRRQEREQSLMPPPPPQQPQAQPLPPPHQQEDAEDSDNAWEDDVEDEEYESDKSSPEPPPPPPLPFHLPPPPEPRPPPPSRRMAPWLEPDARGNLPCCLICREGNDVDNPEESLFTAELFTKSDEEGGWGYTACCHSTFHYDCIEQLQVSRTDSDDIHQGTFTISKGCPACRGELKGSRRRLLGEGPQGGGKRCRREEH